MSRFSSNQNQLRASALTYYSLLSIVPILAALYGVAQGFGLGEIVRKWLQRNLHDHQEVLLYATDFADRFLLQTSGGVIAGVGLLLLFWAVVKGFGYIEATLNAVWGVRTPRPFFRQVVNYMALIVLLPLLLSLASGLAVYLSQHGGVYIPVFVTKLIPFFVTCVVFTVLYMLVPNTEVPFTAALFGGVVAGMALLVWQWVYITFQVGAATYGPIYGSFAAFPLFLIWLHVSWMIVLSGAEISYASQHVDAWEFQDWTKVSFSYQKTLSLYLLQTVFSRFVHEEKATSQVFLSDDLQIPISLTKQLVHRLVRAGLLIETKGLQYVPGRSVLNCSMHDAVSAIESVGIDEIAVKQGAGLKKIEDWQKKMQSLLHDQSPLLIDVH